ncbi:GDSL esterase/lipase At4g10955-like [Rhododendron vialii]|uniref:GDSL esterase/lipase At4g10955-like n=1 Tax=Rhododendron vialii TaxID=182163 RepID=UPI0026604077|nr:GDSL esterase/lipase At4g10955-like [Rhododendron vialii]
MVCGMRVLDECCCICILICCMCIPRVSCDLMRCETTRKNPNHRRSAAASLIQGVYSQEHDRQLNRQGHQAIAPHWWDFFNFRLFDVLVDNADRSIFGAIYEFKSLPPYGHHYPLHSPTRYVVAFRGKMTGWETMSQALTLDLKVIRNTLEQSPLFQHAMQAVQHTVSIAGAANMCLAGHSLGSAMALLAGKNMATMCYVTIALKALNQRPQTGDWFATLSGWIPYLFVNPSDPISAEYVGYFEHRDRMAAIEARAIERLSTRNSISGAIEPLHLLPSACLTINGSPVQGLRQAHGLDQWWKPNIQCRSKLQLISN